MKNGIGGQIIKDDHGEETHKCSNIIMSQLTHIFLKVANQAALLLPKTTNSLAHAKLGKISAKVLLFSYSTTLHLLQYHTFPHMVLVMGGHFTASMEQCTEVLLSLFQQLL